MPMPSALFDPAREIRDAHTRQTSNSEAGYTDAEHIWVEHRDWMHRYR